MSRDPDLVAVVRRWEDAGGVWRVLGRSGAAISVGLYRCDDGEEVDRLVSSDPRVADLLGGGTSEQP